METLLSIAVGVIIGSAITFLGLKLFSLKNYVPKKEFDAVQAELKHLQIESATKISKEDLEKKYVIIELHNAIKDTNQTSQNKIHEHEQTIENLQRSLLTLTGESEGKLTRKEVEENYSSKESYDLLVTKLATAERNLSERDATILSLSNQLAEITEREKSINDKIKLFDNELQNLHSTSKDQFKVLASEIFEEKKNQFVKTNQTEITNILTPFKSDLNSFKDKVEATRKEDIQDLTSLKNEIASLQKLNNQLSDDAKQLALALKSDVKMQGNWGEDRLNMVLEAEGLQKYVDFTREETFKDEEAEINRKPDFILRLPNQKHIIIDSKVSLTAYANYYNATTSDEKSIFLKQHRNSISEHIDRLSEKSYQNLAGIASPDYVFMFMPIESALTLALNTDPELFNYAIKKKIVLVTPSTLIASLKIVKLLWRKESQVKNVQEIFRQAGALYDKFVGFLEHMDKIESGLNIAAKAHSDAMYGLKTGTKKGNTILGRFETLRLLEAQANKQIPEKYLNEINLLESDFEIAETQTENILKSEEDNFAGN